MAAEAAAMLKRKTQDADFRFALNTVDVLHGQSETHKEKNGV